MGSICYMSLLYAKKLMLFENAVIWYISKISTTNTWCDEMTVRISYSKYDDREIRYINM